MSPRQIIYDLGGCLRAAAPPLLTLGVLTLARMAPLDGPLPAGVDEFVPLMWRAAMIATLLWLLVAMVWATTQPRRDRLAFDRLQHLREIGTPPDRAMVHVQTAVWSSPAGQHVVVVNVATGTTSRVWLPETTVAIGSFVVLERTDCVVRVVEWMIASQVEAGHRHEMRRARSNVAIAALESDASDDAASELVRETEEFLKSR